MTEQVVACSHVEVFEIVDRLTSKRVTEAVWLSASAALDTLAEWDTREVKRADRGLPSRRYRVQSVRVLL